MKDNKRLIITYFILIFLITLSASADPSIEKKNNLAPFIEEIRKKSQQIHTLHCHFTQEKDLSVFAKPIVFKGILVLQRPDKLRWEFTAPVPSALLFNGNQGQRCDENNRVDRFAIDSDPAMKVVASQLLSWLNGEYNTLQNSYSFSLQEPGVLLLKPLQKQAKEYIDSVTIHFENDNLQPQSVLIKEEDGDSTHIIFSNHQFNPSLPPSTFRQCKTIE